VRVDSAVDEQNEQRPSELDGWPVPTRDVLRDLERRAPAWPEPDAEPELAAA
jgi:hypothetical protein